MTTKYLLCAIIALGMTGCSALTAQNAPVNVQVALKDFQISSSMTTFSQGVPYHFTITNNGTVAHEFMIMPPMMSMGMSMEDMDKTAVAMVSEEKLPPGATQTLDVTFKEDEPQGKMEFACHVEGHYEAGMKLPIVVQ